MGPGSAGKKEENQPRLQAMVTQSLAKLIQQHLKNPLPLPPKVPDEQPGRTPSPRQEAQAVQQHGGATWFHPRKGGSRRHLSLFVFLFYFRPFAPSP